MYLLLAASILFQDKLAEEALKKIQAVLLEAENITVKSKSEYVMVINQKEIKGESSATLIVEKGNRVYVERNVPPSPGMASPVYLFVSDGANLFGRWEQGLYDPNRGVVKDPQQRRAKTPTDLTSSLISSWVSQGENGITEVLDWAVAPAGSPARDRITKNHLSSPKVGPDDGEAKTLTYDLTTGDNKDPRHDFRIWYDLKSFRLLKRIHSFKDEQIGIRGQYAETYEEIVLNGKIPRIKFEVPKEPPEERFARCANNLRQLWALETAYMRKFGGRIMAMPRETGPAFWLALSKTSPPLIEERDLDLLVCPLSNAKARSDFTSYRGPKASIGTLTGEDPVGCCEPGCHPDGSVTVLQKNGDVRLTSPDQALFRRAMESTTSQPGSLERK